jgi:hypothetical protein
MIKFVHQTLSRTKPPWILLVTMQQLVDFLLTNPIKNRKCKKKAKKNYGVAHPVNADGQQICWR